MRNCPKPFFTIFANILALFIFQTAWAGTPEFENWINTSSLQSELMLVVTGVKPAAVFSSPQNPNIHLTTNQIYDGLKEAFNGHRNSSKLYFFHHKFNVQVTRGGKIIDEVEDVFSVLNDDALKRLIHDEDAMRALKQSGIKVPATSAEAADLYEKSILAGGTYAGGPKWANIAAGITLGFVPSEVITYAEIQQADQATSQFSRMGRRPISIKWQGKPLMAYVRFSDRGVERDRWYQEAADAVMPAYEAQEKALPSERLVYLVEHPPQLPSFPTNLLMKAPIENDLAPCEWLLLPPLGR